MEKARLNTILQSEPETILQKIGSNRFIAEQEKKNGGKEMIDTVVLRVNDLRYHHRLVEIINRDFKEKYSEKEIEVPTEEYQEMANKVLANDTMLINYFSTEGKTRLKRSSLKRLNNSGNYILNAYINKDRDFIEFSFSIPKYLFGTNVLMFTEHKWDKDFIFWKNGELKYNLINSHFWLLKFIRQFFFIEFPEEPPIDFRKVEIDRIDLCFNQVFNNKEQALEFLEYQKKFQRKHARPDTGKYREYETSFMYPTKRYSIKVYHKGAEYAKSDRKEHIKLNSANGKTLFNIPELQSLADCTLRYEVTFRNSMLSYIYNYYVYRSKCPTHRILMNNYKEVEKIKAKNDRIAERLRGFKNEKAKKKYKNKNPFIQISQQDKRNHKYISKQLSKKRMFMLDISPEINIQNSLTGNYGHFETRALFSKNLFGHCAKFLIDFIHEFQVKEKPPMTKVMALIKDYNKTHPEEKLPENEMKKFYILLQGKSFDEIKKTGVYSKATFYRYVNRFEKIGLTKNNVVPTDMIKVNMDLRAYHEYLLARPPLIFSRVLFSFERPIKKQRS